MNEISAQTKTMYVSGYESQVRGLNGFVEMFNLPDFEERRKRLVAGLSKESVDVVNLVLQRLKVVLNLKEGDVVDIYTKEEQSAFDEAKRVLYSKITQVSSDLFIWNGYALPRKHFEPNVFLDGYGFKFIRTLKNIRNKAIIDAGAYIGDSALMLAPFTSGEVFSFEPMGDTFKLLEKTIWLNGLNNVIPVHSALGDYNGTLTMTVGTAGACATVHNRLPGDKLNHEQVDVVKLDDFVRRRGISVGLIKTDVEGAEQMLLKGGKDVIQRDRPILLISIYHNASDFLDIKPMIESWGMGYQFKIYHPPIRSISGETVLIAECNDHCVGRCPSHGKVPELTTANRYLLQTCAEAISAKIQESRMREASLRDGIAKHSARAAALRETVDACKATEAKLRAAIEVGKEREASLRDGIAKHAARAEALRGTVDACKATEAKLRAAIEVGKEREASLRDGIAKHAARATTLRETVDACKATEARLRSEIELHKGREKDLSDELDKESAQIRTLQERIVSFRPYSFSSEEHGHLRRLAFLHPIRCRRLVAEMRLIASSPLFDAEYYRQNNPEAVKAPLLHFCQQGWHDGRNPSAFFDINDYLNNNQTCDPRENPLAHFLRGGDAETYG